MDYLRNQTLALIGQEFLSQAIASGGSLNSVVAEILLHPRPSTGTEKMEAALTGRIRSDSATLRQGAKNAAEGAAMASTIKTAALSMGETLSALLTVAQAVQNNEMTAADASPAFQSLASKLTATMEGAQYNGISLLDGTNWTGDGRLAVNGDTATLTLQMGNSASTFSLRDLSDMKRYLETNLSNTGGLTALVNRLSGDIATVNTMASGYESLAGSYTSEAKHLEQQADTLALAAQRAQPGGSLFPAGSSDMESSLKNILIDLLLRDQGKLVDTSS